MLRGHVFDKQLFKNRCFAHFIDTFLGGYSGVTQGCELANTNSSVSISDGYFCIRGRFLEEEGGTTLTVEAAVDNDIYCRLVCEVDMSKENTTSELKQADYKILKSTTGYPTLQQENILENGTIYQFELAQFKVTEARNNRFCRQKNIFSF